MGDTCRSGGVCVRLCSINARTVYIRSELIRVCVCVRAARVCVQSITSPIYTAKSTARCVKISWDVINYKVTLCILKCETRE